MSGPWEKYQSKQETAESGPWDKYQTKPAEENGLIKAAKAIDSVTGAPVRSAIGAVQDGGGFGDALSSFWKQLGENPDMAPKGSDIRKKAGIDLGDKTIIDPNGRFASFGNAVPLMHVTNQILQRTSPNDLVDFGIEAVADVTNVVPVGSVAKGLVKGGVKGASKLAKGAAKTSEVVTDFAGQAGKKAVQGFFGVPEESINRYLARHPQLKDKVGAREMMEEVAGRLDEGLNPIRAKLEAAESAVESAKAKRSEDLAELMLKRQEAKDALKLAEEQVLAEAASQVSSRVKQLDSGVKEGASKAFNILNEEGVKVPTQSLKDNLDAGIKSLKTRAVTDEETAVVDLLQRYRERLDKFGPEIKGGDAKRIIQSLDREMNYIAPGSVARMSQQDQALGGLRTGLDERLKGSQAYTDQMKRVADDMGVLSQVGDLSNEGAAARALNSAQRATGKDKADVLRALGSKFGEDYLSKINRSNLPETHKLKGLLAKYRAAKKGNNVKAAEIALDSLRAELGGVNQLTDKGLANIVDRMSSVVRASDPKNTSMEILQKAGDLAGVNMADELADIRTISSFEKGYNRGSANTNLWAALAGFFGGTMFGPAGMVGGVAGGGIVGKTLIDNFGPRVGRIILDQAPLLQKMNPTDWLKQLDVPENVKQKLAKDLIDFDKITQGSRAGALTSKDAGHSAIKKVSEKEPKGESKWAKNGLEKLGIQDRKIASELMNSKEGRTLLIEASDLEPGSAKMKKIKERIEKNWGTK